VENIEVERSKPSKEKILENYSTGAHLASVHLMGLQLGYGAPSFLKSVILAVTSVERSFMP
jgi:hypothetical protein